jgi:hypothetical protein
MGQVNKRSRRIASLDPRTGSLVRAGTVAAAALALILGMAASAEAAKLKAPKTVSVGKKVTVKMRGFPANSKILVTASLHGPASFSGRTLGRTRANASGRARLRARFPSTYKWCDADRKCSTYKWPKKAKIAISANATKPPYTGARKIVRLTKGRR